MVKNNMVDAIVATGAAIVDMDFFEALGFRHYQGTPFVDDRVLAEPLHRPDLRHLHRRGGAPGLRQDHPGDRRRPAPRALLLAGVHPGDGALPDRARREEGLPRPDRLRARRPDLLPGLLRQQRRLRPGPAPGEAPQGARLHRLGQGLPGADPDQDQGAGRRACS
ncbi:MAG: deoxyhypusine synthase family protein [Chromatiales bacterium]|nr:deoxyhypusine synthase family protein [Chromatiales bacterium]